jgi:hypothetical protein
MQSWRRHGPFQWRHLTLQPSSCGVGTTRLILLFVELKDPIGRPPPGAQGKKERWSVVFFIRPGNSIVLRALVEESPMIAEAVEQHPDKNFETGSTAFEWFRRRVKYQRIKNRKVSSLFVERH